MVQIGMLFLAFTILVLLLFTIAAVYYVPKVLTIEHDDEDDENGHAA
jgi:hypothetical protein